MRRNITLLRIGLLILSISLILFAIVVSMNYKSEVEISRSGKSVTYYAYLSPAPKVKLLIGQYTRGPFPPTRRFTCRGKVEVIVLDPYGTTLKRVERSMPFELKLEVTTRGIYTITIRRVDQSMGDLPLIVVIEGVDRDRSLLAIFLGVCGILLIAYNIVILLIRRWTEKRK